MDWVTLGLSASLLPIGYVIGYYRRRENIVEEEIKEQTHIKTLTYDANWKMPIGKYRGRTLHWIVKNDLDYVYWVVGNVDRKEIVDKFKEVLDGHA